MTTFSEHKGIYDLPNELLLQIVQNFFAIRLDVPQSQAFRNKKKERARQLENHRRRSTLYSLCLTSKLLSPIATPILYSAITSTTTTRGFAPLRQFWKTILHSLKLPGYLKYVENLLCDYRGEDLASIADARGTNSMVKLHFFTLSCIFRRCPSIEQISVVSIESPSFTLWRHLLPIYRPYLPRVAGHGFPNLKVIAVQTNIALKTNSAQREFYGLGASLLRSINTIISALSHSSSITKLCTSRMIGGVSEVEGSLFKNVRRLELLECSKHGPSSVEVDNILNKFEGLKHFACHFSGVPKFRPRSDDHNLDSLDFLPNLRRHSGTLESLSLTVNVAVELFRVGSLSFSSLAFMTALKEITITDLFVLSLDPLLFRDEEYGSTSRNVIACGLPSSLEHLIVVCTRQVPPLGAFVEQIQPFLAGLIGYCVVHSRLQKFSAHFYDDFTLPESFFDTDPVPDFDTFKKNLGSRCQESSVQFQFLHDPGDRFIFDGRSVEGKKNKTTHLWARVYF